MQLNKKNLAKLGFKGAHIFCSPTSLDIHWKKIDNTVIFADGINNRIGFFILNSVEEEQFSNNQLSLVPPGFCSPSNSTIKEDVTMVFEGEPKSTKHFLKIIQTALRKSDKLNIH